MAATTTSYVYVHVIEDAINKVRDGFIHDGGPGETVLQELQDLNVGILIPGAQEVGDDNEEPSVSENDDDLGDGDQEEELNTHISSRPV